MLEGANIKLSGTIADINGKSARSIIDTILSGTVIDSSKYDEMYDKKVIAHNLEASKSQIIDDLNGFMSPLQRKMMKELLKHVDELDVHIKHLNDDIDNHMKPDEKQAADAIKEVTGLGSTSAQEIKSSAADHVNCVCAFRSQSEGFLFPGAVSEDQRTSGQQKGICGSSPFHADCHIPHP